MGRRVVRRHTLERGFTKIVEMATDLDGLRDPGALGEMLGQAGAQIEGMTGDDADLGGISEMLDSDEGRQFLAGHVKANLAALRLAAGAMVRLVARWTDDPEFQSRMREAGRDDAGAEALEAKLEARTAEWAELERPELAYAEAAHHALWRLRDQRVERLGLLDYLGVVMVFLDGAPRPFG